jgi:hypothetical protein
MGHAATGTVAHEAPAERLSLMPGNEWTMDESSVGIESDHRVEERGEKVIAIDDILNIIATEATEDVDPPANAPESDLPPLRFDLELVRNPDGSLEWAE